MSADDASRLGGLKYAFLLWGWDEKKTLFLKLNLVVKKIFQWKIQFLYKLPHTWLVSDQWSHSHPLFFFISTHPTVHFYEKHTLKKFLNNYRLLMNTVLSEKGMQQATGCKKCWKFISLFQQCERPFFHSQTAMPQNRFTACCRHRG